MKKTTSNNLRIKTFEYRMRPNKQQEKALMYVLIASRKAYNQCLEELIIHHKKTGKYLTFYQQDSLHGKKEHPDLPSHVLHTTLMRLHRSFANFFRCCNKGKKVGFPRFKNANAWNTIQFRSVANCLEGNYFKAPRNFMKPIRVNVHRPLEGKFKFARIVLRPSGWYLQCVCEAELNPLPKKDNSVGLDMGIRYLVADSNGKTVENPRYAKRSAKKLAEAQRKLAKCKKDSNRRKQAKKIVARIHERVANQRKDTLHKGSRYYIDRYQTVIVEDLKPANIVRNHHLAFAIADASWGMFRQYLESKAESAGRQVIAVAPHYTSQKCSGCSEQET